MPLSEQEQKMLDEMERQLFADDPRLAQAFRPARTQRRDGRRILLGLGGVVLGLILLVVAVSIPAVWLGVLAFLGMLAGAVYAVTAPTAASTDRTESGAPRASARGAQTPGGNGRGDFMRRMEERWDRRSGEDGRF